MFSRFGFRTKSWSERKNYRMIRFFSRYFCCLQRCNLLNIESKKIFWTFGEEVEKVLRRSMMWSAAAMRRYVLLCLQLEAARRPRRHCDA